MSSRPCILKRKRGFIHRPIKEGGFPCWITPFLVQPFPVLVCGPGLWSQLAAKRHQESPWNTRARNDWASFLAWSLQSMLLESKCCGPMGHTNLKLAKTPEECQARQSPSSSACYPNWHRKALLRTHDRRRSPMCFSSESSWALRDQRNSGIHLSLPQNRHIRPQTTYTDRM